MFNGEEKSANGELTISANEDILDSYPTPEIIVTEQGDTRTIQTAIEQKGPVSITQTTTLITTTTSSGSNNAAHLSAFDDINRLALQISGKAFINDQFNGGSICSNLSGQSDLESVSNMSITKRKVIKLKLI